MKPNYKSLENYLRNSICETYLLKIFGQDEEDNAEMISAYQDASVYIITSRKISYVAYEIGTTSIIFAIHDELKDRANQIFFGGNEEEDLEESETNQKQAEKKVRENDNNEKLAEKTIEEDSMDELD